MKKISSVAVVCFVMATLLTACAMNQKKVEERLKDPGPVDCSTADGDLRLLQQEKANVAERIVEGVTSIYPAGLVLGVVMGTETTKVKVAIGDYNKAIDQRIAQIKDECGVE